MAKNLNENTLTEQPVIDMLRQKVEKLIDPEQIIS